MIEGKTKTGFKFKVDERIGEDWRVVSAIAMVESGNPSEQIKGTTDLVRFVLGDNENKLVEHIAKKNDGFVSVKAIANELTDILTAAKETKN